MTRLVILLSLFIWLISIEGYCQINTHKNTIVVIDPGHGGIDSGAIGINELKEKDVALNIALEIVRLNEQSKEPLDIYLTRYNDTLISLSDRTKLAKVLRADLFLSLHCNHSVNPNANGVEVYVSKKQSNYANDSAWLAYKLQEALNKNLGFKSRGVKFANFQVLRKTVDFVPGALLELGFLSNWEESNYFEDKENVFLIALFILKEL